MKQVTIYPFPWENASLIVPSSPIRRFAGKLGAISRLLLPAIFLCLLGAVPTANGNTVVPHPTEVAPISQTADLSLVKTVNDNTADQNQVVTFTIVVSNAGNNPATNASVRDVVPAGMTFVVGSQTGPGTYNSGSPGTTGVNWENLLISVGGSVTLGFQATVTGAPGSTITNFAEVFTSAESDPDSTPGNGNIGEDDGDTEVVTVNAAIPPVVLTCPTNTTTTTCQTQAAVNAALPLGWQRPAAQVVATVF
ncbi:MAG: DUF11 domain-containing protein [Saprospiraceae bacterium]|nr:DUF11 domain-containing protein [Saprospiraceae bacterium]